MAAKHFGPHENGRFTMAELEAMPGFKRIGDTIRCACPIHGGTKPNFLVTLHDGRGHCWSRQCWGYLDDGTQKAGSGRRVAPYGSAPTPTPAPVMDAPPDRARKDLLRRTWPIVEAAYADSPAAAYLVGRGIPLDVARRGRAGFDQHGEIDPAMRRRVVFPLATYAGEPVNVMGRVISADDSRKRWLALPGTKGYYHPAGLRLAREERRTLYLCEGTVDVLAFMAGGVDTAIAICGTGGVVRDAHLRGVWRVILCLDADQAGQEKGRTIGRLAESAGCVVLQLTADELDGSDDVAAYWQAHGALPPTLRELAAEEETTLDADLVLEYAARYSPDYIAERLTRLYARWDGGEQTRQARGVLADWQAIAVVRARWDAERARTPRDADTGPDDGDTGEAWVEET